MTKDPTSEFASASAATLASPAYGAPPPPPGDTGFFGHPSGLSTLFFTEFWERFSYYGMRGILILFMTAAVTTGGLGWDAHRAGAIYGLYTAFVYLTALPGGWLADRVFGQRNAVLIGGIIIALGHFSLAMQSIPTFFLGLFLIVVGTGLLKPNVSTMVAELYPEGGARRDAGFSIFYMGINLGAFVAPIVIGLFHRHFGWHVAFAIAGVGMTIGLIQYVIGAPKRLGEAGHYRSQVDGHDARSTRLWIAVGVMAALALAVWGLNATHLVRITPEAVSDAGGAIIVFLSLAYFAYVFVGGGLTGQEKTRFGAILVLFVASVIFWAGFEQAGSSLNLFADRMTNRTIFGWTMPTEWLQSVNSIFIIALAPVFGGLWVTLSRKDREPSSPAKFVIGLVFMGLGFLVMVAAASLAAHGAKVTFWWLVLVYLLHTVGELCLSPVGLSTVTKLAPQRMVGQMMGVWFMSVSLGNFVAGRAGGQFQSMPLPKLFGLVAAVGIACGLLLALFVKPIRRMMAGVH